MVTDETAATGKRSVKIVDAPGLQFTYNPHYTYGVNYPEGRLRNGFSLRIEQNSEISFEWRDWSEGPYQTGPNFSISNGELRVGNSAPVKLPLDQWVHFQIRAGIGQQFDGHWTLTVAAPGQAPREFKGLDFRSSKFKKLTWLGFTSNATRATAFYLDDFTLDLE